MKKKLILYVAMASLLCWASIGVWSGRTLSNAAPQAKTDPSNPNDPGTDKPDPSNPNNPGTDKPDPSNPNDPGTSDPGTSDPGTSDPGTSDPGTSDPGTSNPGTSDPGTSNPGTSNPPSSNNGSSNSSSSNKSTGGSGSAPAQAATTSSMGLPTSVADAVNAALAQGAGSTVVVDTDKVVTSADLRRVAEAGGNLTVFCGPGISWHFAGITNPDAELNPNVDIGADIPEITSQLNGVPGIAIRFMHNGALPGTAYVGLQVPFAEGTTLYFYYYNRSTQLFEFQQTTTVAQGGYAVVALTHCSDYVLTTAPMTSGVANGPVPTTRNAGSLDGTPHTGI